MKLTLHCLFLCIFWWTKSVQLKLTFRPHLVIVSLTQSKTEILNKSRYIINLIYHIHSKSLAYTFANFPQATSLMLVKFLIKAKQKLFHSIALQTGNNCAYDFRY